MPPLAEARTDASGRKVFELTAQPGRREFRPGRAADTFGFNGDFLGPTLRARRGEEVGVAVRNDLDEATSVHWHGMHLPAEADGGPHQPIPSGGSWEPAWYIDQPAATLWYHPHPHGHTERHVQRGLAGLFIIDDDHEAELNLPREYGRDDIPVIVQDKRFDDNGQISESNTADAGMLGDTVLVNGVIGPYLPIHTRYVRLRILNASTARAYYFGFTNEQDFAVIATDGGLLETPHWTNRVLMSPGERVEMIVESTAGESTVLRSFPPDPDERLFGDSNGGQDSLDILELRPAADLADSPDLPERLTAITRLAESDAVAHRSFSLRSQRINGQRMDMNRIDETVLVDTVEVWEVNNDHGQYHNFHVHDVQFQVLDGDDDLPEAHGWKDTVFMPRRSRKRLIMRFADYADPSMPYMYHCHLLRHEDQGMMGQFLVLEPGQQPQFGTTEHEHD